MTLLADPYQARDQRGDGLWTATAKCDSCDRPSSAVFQAEVSQGYKSADARMARLTFDAGKASFAWQPINVVLEAVRDVPAGIDEAAGEAIAALAIGANKAAVLMCRAVIEATAKEHGITQGTLAAKIDKLEEGRSITPGIKDAAHEIRHLGNDMAHGDFATTNVTADEAAEVVEITEAMLAEVYQRPAQIQRMRERRQTK